MGDRAIVAFTENDETTGPCVYLHWAGSEVSKYLEELKELMAGRNDVDYVTARFIGVAHAHNPGNLSLGVSNCSTVQEAYGQDPGDRGVFVVNTNTWRVSNNGNEFSV